MLTWVQVALLSSPEVTVNLAARLTPFIESFAQASSSQGLTQITQIYCNLREASWLTEDEIAKWAGLEDFGASIESTELVGSPLSQVLTAIEFRELKQRASAKADPDAFASGNRKQTCDRFKQIVPALKRGGSASGDQPLRRHHEKSRR